MATIVPLPSAAGDPSAPHTLNFCKYGTLAFMSGKSISTK
jgi:hypothetical protein